MLGRNSVAQAIAPSMKARVSPIGSFLWAFSGCSVYYTYYCPIPFYNYGFLDHKSSLALFSCFSLYNLFFGLNSRTMISRIQLLNDGQHILVVDGIGNTTKVSISEVKVETYHESINTLEINYAKQIKKIKLSADDQNINLALLYGICHEDVHRIEVTK